MAATLSETSDRAPWSGDISFAIRELVFKDFKIRYRNMSLGVFWSLLNPLVMMGVLWFVFTKIFPNNSIEHFGVFALCGLVPFNFFTIGWVTATTSLVDNAALVKRVPIPREIIPISTVLSHSIHLLIQIGLLVVFAFGAGKLPNIHWLWLFLIFGCELLLICGLGMLFAILNVYIRDTRYVVESINTVLFWLVPIVYPFSVIPAAYKQLYTLNPLSAIVFAIRDVVLQETSPASSLLLKLVGTSVGVFLIGFLVFRYQRRNIYDHL